MGDKFTEILTNSGALMEGHTLFKNGFHGNGWIEKGFIIRQPKLLDLVTSFQAETVIKNFPNVDLIIGPIVNGSIVAAFVAKHLSKEFAITIGKGDEIEFHRMNIPKASRKAVLIEDLIFTGTDIENNLSFLRKKGFTVLGVSAWINRRKNGFDNIPVIELSEPPFKQYQANKCPLCKADKQLIYRGIRE